MRRSRGAHPRTRDRGAIQDLLDHSARIDVLDTSRRADDQAVRKGHLSQGLDVIGDDIVTSRTMYSLTRSFKETPLICF